MTHGILAEMTLSDFGSFRPEVALLPVASTEVHGPHLPFGSDALTLDLIARATVRDANARGARALMLPTLPYGIDTNMMHFPYTITLQPRTLVQVLSEIASSLERHGVPKVLMVSGHFQNKSATEMVCQEFAERDIFVAKVEWWTMIEDARARIVSTTGEHADEFETSIGLALYPELVQMQHVEPSPTARSRLQQLQASGGSFVRPWQKFTSRGATGNPEQATSEKGHRLFAAAVARLSDVLTEVSDAKIDATFPFEP